VNAAVEARHWQHHASCSLALVVIVIAKHKVANSIYKAFWLKGMWTTLHSPSLIKWPLINMEVY